MTRIIGPTGSRRRRRFLILPILGIAAAALILAGSAQAVHTGFFELGTTTTTSDEGGVTNILGNTTDTGPDWADLFTATGDFKDSNSNGIPDFEENLFGVGTGGIAAAFISDPSSAGGASDPTTFSGFGTSNKNVDPISTPDCTAPGNTYAQCTPWGWDPGNIPAKDDLTNVYAYEVVNPANNHLLLYGGAEREDPSGDSHLDLEFFQNQVSLCNTANCTSFVGTRKTNDVIVSMDYLQGGALGSVTVRKWSGSDYVLQGTAGGQGCFVGDEICAFNNGGSIDGGPWPNLDNHGKVITTLQQNAFTEIGVDLTALIGASPCLSTFMAKTRSSGSFTSELKDFAGPKSFNPCKPSTALTVSPTSAKVHSGGSVTLTFSELNNGNESLLNPSVATNNAGCSPTKTSGDTNNNGKLDPGETWVFTCTIASVSANVTVVAWGIGTGALSGILVTGNPTCTASSTTICSSAEQKSIPITVISPSTQLTKTASAVVTYTYAEKNDGNASLTNVSVSDPDCGTVSPKLKADGVHNVGDTDDNGKLDANETWLFTCQKTVNGPTTDTGNTSFDNTGTGTGTDELNSVVTACADPLNPPTGTICKNEKDTVNVTITNGARSGG